VSATLLEPFVGNPRPTFEWCPDAYASSGPEVVEFAGRQGVILFDWQDHILGGAMGEDSSGMWACNEVVLIVPRQNGKTEIIIARELSGLFVFNEKLIIHSAHQQRTSNDAFERMKTVIESNPDLDKRVVQIHRSKGEEGFILKITHDAKATRCAECAVRDRDWHIARLRYMARSGSGGRGFTKADTIILDEAMILDTAPIAALLPIMATQPQWQVWYCGSQGDRKLPYESRVLGGVRRRGYRKESGLYMAEWAAHLKHDKTCPTENGKPVDKLDVRGDRRTWMKTNPSAGLLINESFLRKMIVGGAMSVWDADREWLGVGDYPSDEGWSLVGESLWESLQDNTSKRVGGYAVGISTARDGSVTSISMAAKNRDGLWHWEWLRTRPGMTWVPEWCKRLKASKPPVLFVMHGKSPIYTDVETAVGKKLLHAPDTTEYPSWCAKMLSHMTETHDARHIGQATLTAALKHVQRKEYPSGSMVWNEEDTTGDVTPWVALTLAMGGVLLKGTKTKSRPMVAAV
jgi:hypothetical protein